MSETELVDEEGPAGPLGKREWLAIIGGGVFVLAVVLFVLTTRGGNDPVSAGGTVSPQPVTATSPGYGPADGPCVNALMGYMQQSLNGDQRAVETSVGTKYGTSDAMYGMFLRLQAQLNADVAKSGANGALGRILPSVRQECG